MLSVVIRAILSFRNGWKPAQGCGGGDGEGRQQSELLGRVAEPAFVCAPNTASNNVSVIDASSNQVTATVPVQVLRSAWLIPRTAKSLMWAISMTHDLGDRTGFEHVMKSVKVETAPKAWP